MKISLDNGDAAYRITAYAPGSITINEEIIETAVIVSATGYAPWPVESMVALTMEHLQIATAEKPDILLLGTGKQQHFPAHALIQSVAATGCSLEAMDTAAACRTYNILIAEERRVAAALLLI